MLQHFMLHKPRPGSNQSNGGCVLLKQEFRFMLVPFYIAGEPRPWQKMGPSAPIKVFET